MDISDINLVQFGLEESDISSQSYGGAKVIQGVSVKKLQRFKDDGGAFLEIARVSSGQVAGQESFEVKQINHSYVMPGAIKAWHLHFKQEDIWFVPPHDRLLVGLVDLRKDSPTLGVEMRLVLGEGEAQQLLIPRGVAHGCANLYERPMQLIYLVNQQFDASDPDEHRLPYDAIVGHDFWTIQKG